MGTFESVRDKIIFEILKFLAKRIWLASLGTAAIAGVLEYWAFTMWEVMALWILTSTLVVMVILVYVREKLLPKDLFLRPRQRRLLIQRLRPYVKYEITIICFFPEGQIYALDLAGVFSEVGFAKIEHAPGTTIRLQENFEICGPDVDAANQISQIFNSVGLVATYRGTVATKPIQLSVLIGRFT